MRDPTVPVPPRIRIGAEEDDMVNGWLGGLGD